VVQLDRVSIRAAEPSDAAALAELAGELGYPTDASVIAARLDHLPPDNEVLVAERAGEVLGWAHVSLCRSLLVEDHVEVMGLVVGERWRGLGIGRQLMAAAESMARQRGLSLVRLRSGSQREGAHEFYRTVGYSEWKRQIVFVRRLED
jgi:GNAT superfamily N-acetyltransferase